MSDPDDCVSVRLSLWPVDIFDTSVIRVTENC